MGDPHIKAYDRQSKYWQRYVSLAEGEVSTLSRWLTASLLAINGAGALAVADAAKTVSGLDMSGFFFLVGVTFALLSAWLNQLITAGFIQPATSLEEYWAQAAIDGERDSETEVAFDGKLSGLNRWRNFGAAAGWLSYFAFMAGAILLMLAMQSAKIETERVCESLRADLLTSSNSHVESRERFIALGCAR